MEQMNIQVSTLREDQIQEIKQQLNLAVKIIIEIDEGTESIADWIFEISLVENNTKEYIFEKFNQTLNNQDQATRLVNVLFNEIAPKYSIQYHIDNQRVFQESFDLEDFIVQPDPPSSILIEKPENSFQQQQNIQTKPKKIILLERDRKYSHENNQQSDDSKSDVFKRLSKKKDYDKLSNAQQNILNMDLKTIIQNEKKNQIPLEDSLKVPLERRIIKIEKKQAEKFQGKKIDLNNDKSQLQKKNIDSEIKQNQSNLGKRQQINQDFQKQKKYEPEQKKQKAFIDEAKNINDVNLNSTEQLNAERLKRMQRFNIESLSDPTDIYKDKHQVQSFQNISNEHEQQKFESEQITKKQIRCKFFPGCTNNDECPFVHPTEQCKYFPACSNGEKCLFLHPDIECKFGASCTRQNCAYKHPKGKTASIMGVGKNSKMANIQLMQAMMMMIASQNAHKHHRPHPGEFGVKKPKYVPGNPVTAAVSDKQIPPKQDQAPAIIDDNLKNSNAQD